jgi:hypothetical protein
MTDYVKAFRDGLQAAEAADAARSEIDSVFSELDRQIGAASGGKVAIARQECQLPASQWELAIPFRPKKTYWAILAWNPTVPNSSSKLLAKWSQDARGYPCKITFERWERICEDREALENSLAELLGDATVGEKLYGLTKLPQAEEATSREEKPADRPSEKSQ